MRQGSRRVVDAARGFASKFFRRGRVSLKPSTGTPKGDVLLSYITKPFRLSPENPYFNVHSNMWECREIAQTFLDLGHAVDVIDWEDRDFVPKKQYSVLIDIHNNLERLAPFAGKDCLKILHVTGAHWRFQNEAENARLAALQKRRGVSLAPRRTVPPSLGIEHADCATLLGNDVTARTFEYAGKPIYRIPVSSPVTFDWIEGKDFEKCRNRFVWMASSGLVLRGLDIALEAFSAMPDLSLTVCGDIHAEEDFERAYRKELYETPNIRTVGWVDIGGREFSEMTRSSIGLVYPSASEGQSTSVVTCLHAGLIPIVSRESGVDVEGFGRVLTGCSLDEVKDTVRSVSRLPARETASMAKSAWEYARKNHTREAFSRQYRKAVDDILLSRGIHPR